MIVSSKLSKENPNPDPMSKACLDVMYQNPESVRDAEDGKTGALMFLVGQYMRVTRGQGDPAAAREWFDSAVNE